MDTIIRQVKAVLLVDLDGKRPLLAQYYTISDGEVFSSSAAKDLFESKVVKHCCDPTAHPDDTQLFVVEMPPQKGNSSTVDSDIQTSYMAVPILVQTRIPTPATTTTGRVLLAVASLDNSLTCGGMLEILLDAINDAAIELASTTPRSISLLSGPSSAGAGASGGAANGCIVDRAFCLKHYEWMVMLVDAAVESGVILQIDPKELVKRARPSEDFGSGSSGSGFPSGKRAASTVSSAAQSIFSFAKERVANALLRPNP